LIEVYDQAAGQPVLKNVGADDESGRGLAMIDRITGGRWGVARGAGRDR
jgi:serine/threonine-protein kinase RsbW